MTTRTRHGATAGICWAICMAIIWIWTASCVQKPVYNVEVYVAEGAEMTSTIEVDKPMDIKPATQLDLDLLPTI